MPHFSALVTLMIERANLPFSLLSVKSASGAGFSQVASSPLTPILQF
jgi:hypothetical protein